MDARRYQVSTTAAHREVGGEVFLVTRDRNLHHLQEATAVAIYRMCKAEPRTADEIVEAIVAAFDVSDEQARLDVEQFLAVGVQRGIFDER